MIIVFSLIVVFLTTRPINCLGESDVSFYLFDTPDNLNFVKLTSENTDVLNNKKGKITFIIHGWTQSRNEKWYKLLTNILLKKTSENQRVIQVDWSGPAAEVYPKAAYNTKTVGNIVGAFIALISQKCRIDLGDIEIIGHSLGAHVAGFAGKTVKSLTGKRISKIIALDPAGPIFETIIRTNDNKLCKTDAVIVEALHTDGRVFGYLKPRGTIDIYFNGGTPIQPGCIEEKATTFIGNCGHARSLKYFIEALESQDFFATKCNNSRQLREGKCNGNERVNIGGDVSNVTAGEYHVMTNSQSPFRKLNNYV